MKISAKIVADSINSHSERITSFLLVMPRCILSEFNTHRVFSRNSASSRAIPFKKMVEMVENDPFIPLRFQKDHSGMQGTEYFTGWREKVVRMGWISASKIACISAKKLYKLGLTKQLCNRILEPFAWHTVLVTSTDYENFFALRANDAAEIHIQELAYEMLNIYNSSKPKYLYGDEWHIPYGDEIDENKLIELYSSIYGHLVSDSISRNTYFSRMWELRVKIATARCARTSYTTIDTKLKHDYQKDIELCDKLIAQGHFSPLEHCAKAMTFHEHDEYINGWCGNFQGFIQYRKKIKNENRKDTRVNKENFIIN